MRTAFKTLAPAVLVTALAMGSSVQAAPITPGDALVYRVGTGSAALGTAATATFLDEYSPTGTLVQSIAVSSSGASAVTNIGNSTTEGVLTPSPDGSKLVFGGYRLDAGTASVAVAGTTRALGIVDITGVVDTSFSQTGLGTGALRSATINGTSAYLGTSTGVFYAGSSGGAATVIDTRNSRQVFLAPTGTNATNLFASNGSTTINPKVQSYGNAPTGSATPTTVVTYSTLTDAVQGIYFLDLSSTIAGVDTLYLLDTVTSKLEKYSFDGTAWNLTGSVTSRATNLSVASTGSNVSLYLTTPTSLQRINDISGYNGTLAGSISTIATAGTNTAFRGVGLLGGSFTAIPEPTTLAALGGVATMALRRRR